MARAAETLTPVSLELGGKDPMIVLRRRRRRARRQRRGVLLDAERRPDLHLGRARLRRGADLRRVRRARGRRRSARCARASRPAPGTVDVGAMTFPPQLDIVSEPRRGREGGRRQGARRRPRAHRQGPATTSRPCSSTSTTRWRHDRGDVRPDAADHEGAPTPTRPSASPTTRRTASPPRCGRRTPRAARRSRAGSRPARCASTTRRSTTSRSSCRWAAGRRRAWARATARRGIRKYTRQQSLLVTRLAPKKDLHMFPYKARTTNLLVKGIKLLYGRGKRD